MSTKSRKLVGQVSVGPANAEDAAKQQAQIEASKKAGHISADSVARFSLSAEDAAAAAEDDPFSSRVWNFLAWLGGLPTPPGEKAFKEAMAKHGSMDEIRRHHITDDFFEAGFMLHSHKSPYDVQAFFQKASLKAIGITFILYFLFLSSLFAGLAVGLECIPVTPNGGQFIPTGFFLISGLSSLGVNQAAECLWIESFAVLAGVYISLPIFGAFVLIRLLDNSAVNIKLSDHVLLTKRDGRPTILFRVISSNGLVHSGVEMKALFFIGMKDEETGEGYGKQIDIDVKTPTGISFTPSNCAHTVEADSQLLKYGVIVVDEKGTPRWNHKKIGVLKVMVSADKEPGSRKSMVLRTMYDTRYHLLDAHPETGAYPSYVSVSVAALFSWRTSEGKTSPASDLSKFNQWEYSKIMTEKWEKMKREEEAASSQALAVEEGTASVD